jgi:hypothetical protein
MTGAAMSATSHDRAVRIGAILVVCASLGAVVLIAGWDRSPRPPNEPGVCWRADMRSGGKPSFTAITTDAPNIVSCAADLEFAYLTEKKAITGAYQGYYIFAERTEITGAQRLNLIRYPIFSKTERAMVDSRLRPFLKTSATSPANIRD